jgi:hypothetical protein
LSVVAEAFSLLYGRFLGVFLKKLVAGRGFVVDRMW